MINNLHKNQHTIAATNKQTYRFLSQYPVPLLVARRTQLFYSVTYVQPAEGVKLTTRLHIVPRIRMSEAISPLPQYALMEWCLVKHRIPLHGVVLS